MTSLIYGGGICSLSDNSSIKIIQIYYSGALQITSKVSENYMILATPKKIIIAPYGITKPLGELFEYEGTFYINSIYALDELNQRVSCNKISNFSYAEFITTDADKLDIKSEDLNIGYTHIRSVKKTTVDVKTIDNLNTSGLTYDLCRKDKVYNGFYHIHIKDNIIMSGKTHTKDSKILCKK